MEKEIKKDMPSRLHARRQMRKVLYPITEVPTTAAGRKKGTKKVDMPAKILMKSLPSMLTARAVIHVSSKIGQRKGRRSNGSCSELV